MPPGTALATPDAPSGDAQAMRPIPFIRAALERTEPANIDESNAIGANTVQLGPFGLPAFGFLRSVCILVEATGGTGAAAVYKEDAPWTALKEVVLHDLNGAPIFGPLSGYEVFLAHKWGGGVGFESDPTQDPDYVAPATTGNFSWMLRIPLELSSRDALGCLPNQDQSSQYQLSLIQAAKGDVYSTDPTGLPTMRVRVWCEEYTMPAPQNAAGVSQQRTPPSLGTTQFWSHNTQDVSSGQNNLFLKRTGNLVRMLIFILRNSTPARSTTNWPDTLRLSWDGRQLFNEPKFLRRKLMRERYGMAPETGVFIFDMAHEFDGKVGGELRDHWLALPKGARVEIDASFGGAGTLTVLTNDVAPAGPVHFT